MKEGRGTNVGRKSDGRRSVFESSNVRLHSDEVDDVYRVLSEDRGDNQLLDFSIPREKQGRRLTLRSSPPPETPI